MRRGVRSTLLTMMFALLLTGCGGSKVTLSGVSGRVTLDGKPLANARVVFQPTDGGRLSSGVTDEDGHYELSYTAEHKGALWGPHKVSVSTLVEQDTDSSDPVKQAGRPETVPERYNTKTELEREVMSPNETIDLELVSK